MPYLSVPSRREFLAAATGVAVLRAKPGPARWAFLSDTHISEDPASEFRGFRPYDNLREAVPQVLKAAPAGVVIDGDLARLEGLPGDYDQLKRLLDPITSSTPVAMALGNHDDRNNFLAAFTSHPGENARIKGKHILVLEDGPVRFIILDSLTQTNVTPGLLGKLQRDWLDAYLKFARPIPTLVFVHHTLDDGDNALLDVLWMFRILQPHKMIKAVVYGHSHTYKFETLDAIHLVNIPAVGYNFHEKHPVGWVEATLAAEGADFTLRAIGGNAAGDGKVTSVSWRT